MEHLDILAFAAHPDDTELSCSGTLAAHISRGKKVGIIDMTRGEMGTRGTSDQREEEALASARLLGVSVRENLGFEDALFRKDVDHLRAVVEVIRRFRPALVLANAIEDRHPDHARAAELVEEACFLAGLRRFDTVYDGKKQEAFRPRAVYHYIQSVYLKPDIVVDITEQWDKKLASIKSFKSQFYDPESQEPETFISSAGFLKLVEARAREYGYIVGVEYAEGFTINRFVGVRDLFDLI